MHQPIPPPLRRLHALVGCAALVVGLGGASRPADAQHVAQSLERDRLTEAAPQAAQPSDPVRERALERLRADAAPARPNGRARAAAATWLLGLLALHGLGMPLDAGQARSWFEQAHQLGHPLAPAGLAWCAIDGCGSVPQPATARPWLVRLRGVAPARALYLEWLMETRLAPLQAATPDLQGRSPPALPRRDQLARAAREGDVHAQMELGFESAEAGRLQEAVQFFQAAAPRSDAAAFNAASLAEPSAPKAGVLEAEGQAEHWFAQGRRYHQGDGVPANYAEAIRLYEMAAARGSKGARRLLELIFSRPAAGGGVDIAWMQQLAHADVSTPGVVTVQPASAVSVLRHDPTPLYDLVPPQWRIPQPSPVRRSSAR